MNLLIKYYDKDSIGGGIPDEPKKQIWVKPMDSLIDCFNDYEDQISRLREENERLRGEVELLNGSIQQLLFDISKGRL